MNKIIYKLKKLCLLVVILFVSKTVCLAQELALDKEVYKSKNSTITQANQKLKDVLIELRNYYQVDILFADQVVKDHTIPAGLLNLRNKLEENLEAVLKPLGLRFKKTKDGSYLITPGPAMKKNICKLRATCYSCCVF